MSVRLILVDPIPEPLSKLTSRFVKTKKLADFFYIVHTGHFHIEEI